MLRKRKKNLVVHVVEVSISEMFHKNVNIPKQTTMYGCYENRTESYIKLQIKKSFPGSESGTKICLI